MMQAMTSLGRKCEAFNLLGSKHDESNPLEDVEECRR